MSISIILPVYNAEAHLKSTIQSIINQTYPNFELIIVDDCSTDASFDIISDLIQIDSRITYYKLEKNSGGPARPRNFGINKAIYSLIAFIDSDDIWHSKKLEIQYNFLKSNSKIKFISSIKTFKHFSSDTFPKNLFFTILKYNELLKKNFIINSSVLVYKEYLYPFDINDNLIAVEDAKQWLDITKNGINCYLIDYPLVYYRKVDNSLSYNKLKMLKKRILLIKKYTNGFVVYFYITFFLFYSILILRKPLFKKSHKFILCK